jgi:aryl-alcohol dehydrogenase-like predicted oxidoreductase
MSERLPFDPLPYPTLGHSGLKVSPLWLGTMTFGGSTDEAEAGGIVDAARDAGLNGIDTADAYTGGESERLVGRLIARDRSRWVLATKVANPGSAEPNDRGLSRRWVTQAVERSLQRLGTDWIDVYYMHRDDESTPIEETLQTFARLIEQGKIRYYGVSNFRAWRMAKWVEASRRMGVPPPIVCQPPYNAMSRQIETEVLPCCNHYGLGAVVYSPLARGVLTGKYREGQAPEPGSRGALQDKRLMQTEFRAESMQLAQQFVAHARSRGFSPAALALAWALNNRRISGVIGGPRTLAQWTEYLQALSLPFNADDEALISGLVAAGHASTPGYTDPIYPVTGREPRVG